MKLGSTVPILRSFDEAKAKEFYMDFLGFSLDWEHRFDVDAPLYMQLSKNDCVLHLSEHHGDSCPGTALRIQTSGLDEFQQQLLGKRYKNSWPHIQEMPWGSKDMTIADPFGNKLTFTDSVG